MKLLFVIISALIAIGAAEESGENANKVSNPSVAFQGFLPFVASVHNGTAFLCAGVIVSVNWILTSASCVYGYSPSIGTLKVKVGGVKHGTIEPGRDEISANQVKLHPHFTVGNLPDNIALLHLERNIVFGDYIQPVPLATPDKPLNITQYAIVAGWGSAGGAVTILEYNIYFKMMNLANCEAILALPTAIPNALCTDNVVPNPHAYTMDIGGPLLQFDSVLGMVLYGITSFATGARFPTVYESIVAHRAWIFTVTGV